MYKPSQWNRLFIFISLILMLILAVLGPGRSQTAIAGPAVSAPDLAAIWQLAQQRGSYRFTADVEQSFRPRPTVGLIGQSSEHLQWRLEGQLRLPDEADLYLSSEANNGVAPLLLIQRGAQTFAQVEGELVEIENPLGANAMPGGDYLSYLAAAQNVRQLEPQVVSGETFSVYAFDIDGPALASHLQQQTQAMLPAGQQAVTSPIVQAMYGRGELWVDSQGLPRRQIVDLEVPGATAEYDGSSHAVIDFYDFGQVDLLPRPVETEPGAWTLEAAAAPPAAFMAQVREALGKPAGSLLQSAVLITLALAGTLLLAAWYQRRPRQVYATVALTISLLMLFTPLLQPIAQDQLAVRQAEAAPPGLEEVLGLAALPTELSAPLLNPAGGNAHGSDASPQSPSEFTPLAWEGPACGDGAEDTSLDSDTDGLADYVEYCLGTDPFNPDTSGDGIPDGVKVDGFEYNGRWWPMDPFSPDSNQDGVSDYMQLPQALGGASPEMDSDNDGVPNLWDADMDGDGIPNRLDYSPYSYVAPAGGENSNALVLNINGNSDDSHLYVDLQVVPEDEEQLRYSTVALDWPDADDEGTMRVMSHSTEDMRLVPILLIETNSAPSTELAGKYGVTILPNEGGDATLAQRLYAPLLPVYEGRRIVAYQTRVAYPPANSVNLTWKVQLGWMVEGHVDTLDENGVIVTESVPLAIYDQNPFVLAGLQVLKSAAYETALFSVPPDHPDNPDNTDQPLHQMLFALNSAFLNAREPEPEPGRNNEPTALREFQYRFDRPGMDNTFRFGLSAEVATDVRAYTHRDEAMAAISGTTAQFLQQHYPQTDHASLILAYQERFGRATLDTMTPLGGIPAGRDPLNLNVPLNDITMTTQRGVQLNMLERRNQRWSVLEMGDAAGALQERYSDVEDTLAAFSNSPELTAEDIRAIVVMFYSSWHVDNLAVVSVDGQQLLPPYRSNQEIYEQLSSTHQELPTYLIEIGRLNQPGGGLKIGAGQSLNWGFAHSQAELLNTYLGLSLQTSQSPEDEGMLIHVGELDLARVNGLNVTLERDAKIIKNVGRLVLGAKMLIEFGTTSGPGHTLGTIGLAIQLGIIWSSFALATDFDNPLAVKTAVAYAVVATVFAVALFAMTFNPFSTAVVVLIVLAELIFFLVTGDSLIEEATKAVANFFYSVNLLSEIKALEFTSGRLDIKRLSGSGEGIVVGNHLIIEDQFTGIISGRGARHSSIYARYLAAVESDEEVRFANQNSAESHGQTDCVTGASLRTCTNQVGAAFSFLKAGPNIKIYIQSEIASRLRYEECGLIGLCTEDNLYDTLTVPETVEPIVLDVLPATVQELWAWDLTPFYPGHVFNPAVNQSPPPAAPHPFYLSDNDRDGDGLLDSEEIIHLDGNGELVGGWQVTLPDGRTAWLSSNPFEASTSGDGRSDASKQASGLSPYALHRGPRVVLAAEPTPVAENGRAGVYALPDDTITFDLNLLNSGTTPISGVLSLCLPEQLSNLSGGAMSGPQQPPLVFGECGDGNSDQQLSWDFSQSPLLVGQLAQTTITVTAGIAQSANLTAVAQLPYEFDGEERVAIEVVQVYVDDDLPTVAWDAPETAAIIGGGITSYVLGGTTGDSTSWVKDLTLSLPGGDVPAVLGTGSETGRWAYTWDLPADGDYTLVATATDLLNHTNNATVQVRVDNTPPVINIAAPPPATYVGGSGDEVITIPIQGTVSDNLSGVTRLQLSLNDQPWRTVPVEENGQWHFDWLLANDPVAQGQHTLRTRAYDRAGNASEITGRTLVVDLLPPTSELSDRSFLVSFPSYPSGQAITLEGVANDAGAAPLPAAPTPLAGSVHGLADATLWLEPAALADSEEGLTLTWLGDFNGDRLADLAIGLPGAAGGDGRITLVEGQAGGWPTPPDMLALSQSNTSFRGTPTAGLGTMMAAAGDVNGDGFADLLVGDPAGNRAYLVPGRAADYGRDISLDTSCAACRLLLLPDDHTLVGLAAAGDVSGDGYDDYFVLADTVTGRRAYLMLGDNLAPPTLDPVAMAAVVVTLAPGSTLVAGVGDRDGDQYSDFVAHTAPGQLAVYHGLPLAAAAGLEAALLNPGTISTSATHLAALGDTNGDELADFAYGSGNSVTVVRGAADRALGNSGSIALPGSLAFLAGVGNVSGAANADILVGNGDDALLYDGGNLNTPLATLTGVAQAAAAPYSAGADYNADGSADLLLVPAAGSAADLGFGEPQPVDQSALPVSSGGTTPGGAPPTYAATLLAEADRHVSTNGHCDGYAPCHWSVAEALGAANDGDTIAIHPGRYDAFTVSGRQNLTLSGVHADAVFIDGAGSFAARIENSNGIALAHMTLGNATNGVELVQAGVGGYDNAALQVTLSHLFIHEFSGHALFTDRVSTAVFRNSTIAGHNSEAYLAVDSGAPPDPAFTPTWSATTPAVANGTQAGGGLLPAAGDDLYAVRGGETTTVNYLTPGSTNITTFDAPAAINNESGVAGDLSGRLWLLTHRNESPNGPVRAIEVVSDNEIYIGGTFTQIGDLTLDPPNVAGWNGTQWQSLSGNYWGFNKDVFSLEWDEARQRLYVGLSFENPGSGNGGVTVRAWTKATSTWSGLQGATTGIVYDDVYALALNTSGSRLYVGGRLGEFAGLDAHHNGIAYYDFAENEWRKVDGRFTDTNISTSSGGVTWSFQEGGGGVWRLAPSAANGGPTGCNIGSTITRQCRLPGIVYDLVVRGSKIYIGGEFAYVGGGGTGGNAVPVINITGYGVAAFDESLVNGLGECQGGGCWTTYGRDSFNLNNDTRRNGQARGAGEAPAYRPTLSNYFTDLAKGTNSNPVYALAWVENDCFDCVGGGQLAFGGDFTVYNWQDSDGNNQVNDAIGSSELIHVSKNVALTSWPQDGMTVLVTSGAVRTLESYDPSDTHFSRIIAGGDFPTGVAFSAFTSNSGFFGLWYMMVNPDGLNNSVLDIGKSDNLWYFVGPFSSPYSGGSSQVAAWPESLVNTTNTWQRPFDHRFYSVTSGGSATLLNLPVTFNPMGPGTVLVSNDAATNPALYAMGGGSRQLWHYNSQTATWSPRALLPLGSNIGASATAVWTSQGIYLLHGDGGRALSRYDLAADTWAARANAPYDVNDGASMAWDGGNVIYVVTGGGRQFLRYLMAEDSWQTLGDGQLSTPADLDTPAPVDAGAGLALGDNTLYLLGGNGSTTLYQFGPLDALDAGAPDKLVLDELVFINEGSAASWHNLAAPLPDFNIVDNGNHVWVGSTWTPTPGDTPLTLTSAAFLNASLGIYRQTVDTPFTAGYHTYTPDVTVSTDGCGGDCYTTIQDGLYSGANNVLVLPGQYPQNLYLLSGVNVAGSGADTTVIIPPDDPNGGALVTAVAVRGASFSGFTIDGEGWRGALWASDGARGVRFSRNIVRDTFLSAIIVWGEETSVEIVNNTLVKNAWGIEAGDCPQLNVRNNILAFNSETALAYFSPDGSCPAGSLLNKYNLYWENDSDYDGLATPGPGERFADPLFLDLAANDLRTQPFSPAVNGGDPGDPAPPGAGRVDIGYLEQGGAGLYVSAEYCAACLNDGLTFGVNAFSAIQPALDAAGARIRLLAAALDDPLLTVAVAPGIYTESISLPSYVHLVGSGAEQTIIDAAGSGSAVTMDAVVGARISGFTIRGASGNGNAGVLVSGAANRIMIQRNLIHENTAGAYGVQFTDQASGQVLFNTIVANSGNVRSDGDRTWAIVRNNILADSAVGLHTQNDGRLLNGFNLLQNVTNYQDDANTGLDMVSDELVGVDPLLSSDGLYRPQLASPAVDAADPLADVPTGGGDRADLGYFERRAIPLALFLGDEGISKVLANSGVAGVETAVVFVPDPSSAITETLPATGDWTNATLDAPGETVSAWQRSFTPGQDGLYRIYSRATDEVGNVEGDAQRWFNGAFLADGTPPAVTWEPVPANGNAPFELRVLVEDSVAGFFNVAEVYFTVDGAPVPAVWAPVYEDANRTGRVFRAWVAAEDGPLSVQAFAVDRAGNVGQSSALTLDVTGQNPADTTPPTLVVNAPADGLLAGGSQVTFQGTVADTGSGVATVQVSVDGGYSWMPAQLDGGDWQLLWETPADLEGVSFPLRIRALDNAGNEAGEARQITVDNRPAVVIDLGFSKAPGHYSFGADNGLGITWAALHDGGGPAELFAVVDDQEITTTFDDQNDRVSGNSFATTLPAGTSYLHLTTRDAAGNLLQTHLGPWHQDRVLVNGSIEQSNSEWDGTIHLLDDDERGLAGPAGQPQQLYTRWDQDNFYLGWAGAHWKLDGSMWVYLSTGGAGTTTAVEGQTLPFAANMAVLVTNPGTRYEYSGGSWQPAPLDEADYAQGESGATEVRLPFGSSDSESVRMLAFATDDTGRVWSVFPTDNALDGPWNSHYEWPDLAAATETPNAGQPRGYSVDLALSSPQATTANWGPGTVLGYAIRVTNNETAAELSGLTLTFDTSDGLTLQGNGTVTLGDLAPGASETASLEGLIAADLTDISVVTMSVTLSLDGTVIGQSSLSHLVDGIAPTVEVFPNPAYALSTGLQSFSGTATDGNGSGVALVEVSADGSNWQAATGTQLWSATVDVPAGSTFTLHLRATDHSGNVSPVVSVPFTVDSVPPDLAFTLPPVATTPFLNISGTAMDPAPAGGHVALVEMQVNDGAWLAASGPFEPDTAGAQHWAFIWDVPYADGVSYELRARATDAAGNVSPVTAPQTILVDRVAPTLTATQLITETSPGLYLEGNLTGPPVLEGTAADGGGVGQVLVTVQAPDGSLYTQVADLELEPDGRSGSWRYTPTLLPMVGEYQLTVHAVDLNGNELALADRPVFILLATNSAPVANDDAFETDEKTPLTALDLLANDMDPDEDELTITTLGPAGHGSATLVDGLVNYDPAGQFDWLGTGMLATDTFTYTISDPSSATATAVVTITVNGVNDAPLVGPLPGAQEVQYSDGITAVTLSAADVDATADLAITATLSGPAGTFVLPVAPDDGEAGLQVSAPACSGGAPDSERLCEWTLSGAARLPAGVYTLALAISDGESATHQTVPDWLTVTAEDARLTYDVDNPISVEVATPGGTAAPFSLWLEVQELVDGAGQEPAGQYPLAGDINQAQVSIILEPVGPGAAVGPVACESTSPVAAYDYEARLQVRCDFPAELAIAVNVYTVLATVGGGSYQGATEAVVVIYDPSLGTASGGGWFYWPGTADPDTGYPGDRTTFGFTTEYVGRNEILRGSLLLFRYEADGTIHRLMSNTLNGMALGIEHDVPMGWASITGKGSFVQRGPVNVQGSGSFVLYVEDYGEPGNGQDRFWLQVSAESAPPPPRRTVEPPETHQAAPAVATGVLWPSLSMEAPATTYAVPIEEGNIAVPH